MSLYLNGRKIVDGVFQAGTAAAPSITFASDPNTGLYSYGADKIGIAVNGSAIGFFDSSLNINTIKDLVGGGGRMTISLSSYEITGANTLTSNVADSGSAIGLTTNTPAYTTSGAKLQSWKNNNVEKAYITKDGEAVFTSNLTTNGSLYIAGGTLLTYSVSGSFTNRAAVADGATAIAHRFYNNNALTTAGAKIASWYSDNGTTEKMYVDKDGNLVISAVLTAGAGSVSFGQGMAGGYPWYSGTSVRFIAKTGGMSTTLQESGADKLAFALNTETAFARSGSTLFSIGNGGTEKFKVGIDGGFTCAAASSIGTSAAFTCGTIELGAASDTTLSRSAAGVLAVEGVDVPTISSTSTLTNKRITKRVTTTTDDATAVIDTDTCDVYELSAVANNTEFTLTGTPTNGQQLLIRIKDAGVSKNLTWTGFTAIGVTLPAATTAGKWHYVGCHYNSAGSAWHVISVTEQA